MSVQRLPALPVPAGRIPALPGAAALAVLLATALLATAGCATARKPQPPISAQASGGPTPAPPPAWEIPAAAYGTQILYRVTVSGAAGEGSFKLALRLAASDRYQAQAVDPLGRALWGVDVTGDHGLWLDHRSHTWCRLAGALDLAFLPLGPLSLSALPPLLLGRLPVPPAEAAAVSHGAAPGGAAGSVAGYRDAAGRGWSAVLQGGQLVSWGLWQEPAPGPILSWMSSGGWSVLKDRRKGIEVRWRETVREPLRTLVPIAPRPDDRQVACAGGAPAAR
jgi:hypothetical protein